MHIERVHTDPDPYVLSVGRLTVERRELERADR